MKIDIFTLCDSAQEYNGKLVIVGTFNTITCPSFPAIHPEMSVVARISLLPEESGTHLVKLSIKSNEDGSLLLAPVQTSFAFAGLKQNGFINVIVKGNSLKLERPGTYTVVLEIDNMAYETELFVNGK